MRFDSTLSSYIRKALYFASAAIVTTLVVVAQQPGAPDELTAGSKNVIQAPDLVKVLNSSDAKKPLVLYVGPRAFYQQAHITGAEFVGPAGRPEGLEKLRARAASLPHDKNIVLYCGCCPWDHCPNTHPALRELQKMGFSNVRVLQLPTSFGADWADKGYPTSKGE